MIKEQLNTILEIPVDTVHLSGELIIPPKSLGLVIFSHGSGSSRLSPRNRFVAAQLQRNNFGTLLFDLLTPLEDSIYANRFNIELLTIRLIGVYKWLRKQPGWGDLNFGFFGASTGAASALSAAASLKEVHAVVSRGGRPDLVLRELPQVQASVRLIVGGLDDTVIALNKKALHALESVKHKDLVLVEGATHLFEEPGTLEEVAVLATEWFKKYL